MKHFYAALALLGMTLGASAEGYRSVAVNLTDGTAVEITFTDDFSASFTETDFVVTGVDTDITVPRNTIKSFTFLASSGVNQIGAESNAPTFTGNSMVFENLPAGSLVTVYNLSGAVLLNEHASGAYSLDLSVYAGKTVIVSVNGVAYKIATK